ncbi:MAG: hypothetical protein MRECE_8c042 [Mycoplasmataceae bacterium CE_OT135]|nr:MAG: hypothetical protein MRECE_8c042 [Mycoplasmataceae bacterium CE_OT135]
MGKEKEDIQQSDFEEIRRRFNKWRFNMYLCAVLYIIFFVVARLVITEIIQKGETASWLSSGSKQNRLPIIVAAIILGFCFIADSVITSYLKTPLQRLAIKIENSSLEEKKKSNLMRTTQETNELFKETFKKFGILVIPTILISLIDGKGGFDANKPSEDWFFYICYLVPILFASYRIWKVNSELNKIKKKVTDEQKKQLRS